MDSEHGKASGVFSQGESIEDLKDNIRDVYRMVMEEVVSALFSGRALPQVLFHASFFFSSAGINYLLGIYCAFR